MKNNSSQSRFAKITAKVIVMLLAVVLSLSVLPTLSADILPTAEAATEYVVPSGATIADINNKLASFSAGEVVNMNLSTDISLTNTSTDTYSSGFTGITIPAGITVNLFMNGKKIEFNRPSGGAYRLPYYYAIVNKGTLNVYSGVSTTASTSTAAINVINVRTGMECNEEKASTYVALEAIHNEGTLTVNNKVAINVQAHSEYDGAKGSGASVNVNYCEQVMDTAIGIYNASSSTCTIKGAIINATAFAYPYYRTTGEGGYGVNTTAVAYGVYGGIVNASHEATITVNATAKAERDTCTGASEADGRTKLTGIAYGIVANGKVNVTGAKITSNVDLWANKALTHSSSAVKHYSGGIYTVTGNLPVIPDADITVNAGSFSCEDKNSGENTYNKGTVVSSSALPTYPTTMVASNISFNEGYKAWPANTVSASAFYDEAGNSYSTNLATASNTAPTAIDRGALAGTNRVHVVYRYWVDRNKSAIDTSIVGNEGNVGYSYKPLTDGTNVVNTIVTLSGVSGKNILVKSPDATIKYLTGGDSCNSYYWGLVNIAYATTSDWFSDYNVTSTANKGTTFKTFASQGGADNSTPVNNGPIYIFVDYARLDASSIKAKVGTANAATTTYTGAPIKASSIGLQILASIGEINYTNDYNIDFADSSLINVTYSYTGINSSGVEEVSESGQLPTNAGTYDVTLKIAESTTYDKNPKLNKNRHALEYTFKLVIDKASVLRGGLPDDITLTYGQRLDEVLTLKTYACQGIASDTNVIGNFSFKNPNDGAAFKNAGENQTVTVKWTPVDGANEVTGNYKETEFTVNFKVNKASLTIKPNGAAVVYGNTDQEFDTPYNSTIIGLVGNDTGDSAKNAILNALNYMVLNGTSYVPYVAGEVGAGTYYIRANFTEVPSIMSNYEYTFVYGADNNEEGVLRVAQKAITVEATAKDRAYIPGNYNVDVSFVVTDGKFGVDDVRISDTTGGLSNNGAGVREVSGITKQSVAALVTGGAGKNYYVADVKYKTGATLLVTISKAVPTVTTPIVEEMYYQNGRKLSDIEFAGYTATVEGNWQWVDPSVTPSVRTATYKAEYVPQDQANYEIKTVDIAIKVKATPVIISYAGSVSYGDNIPNITAYTYKADLDPTFDIDAVTTSGNITPSTDYVKGSPVIEGGYAVEIAAPNFIDVNGNYTFTTQNGIITVNPRVITFTVNDTTAVYGENFVPSASTVTFSYDETLLVGTDTIENVTLSGTAPTFEYSTDFRYIDNYKVGTYYVKITPNFVTSPNYTVATVPGKLTVTRAQLVIKADDITLEYGSAIPADISSAYTVVGAKRNETAEEVVSMGAIKVDTTYQKGSPVNAEGYPISVDVTGATFDNYIVSVQHGTITVIKATPKIIELPKATITHGQSLGDAEFKGGSVENDVKGKYLYNSASTTPAYRTEAYTIYTATFIPDDKVNYNSVTGLYVELTVNLKQVTGALAVSGVPMVGGELKIDVTGLDPDELGVYTITWFNAAGTQIGTGAQLTLTEAHKLQKLTVKAVANAPYTGEVAYTTTVIAPHLTSVETILDENDYSTYFALQGLSSYGDKASYVYNAQPHYVGFQRTDASLSAAAIGKVDVKYNGSSEAPTKVGYYKVTIDISTPEGIENMTITTDADGNTIDAVSGKVVYSPIANYEIGTLVITPAPYYVTVKVDDKVYDGTGAATAKVTDEYGACELTDGSADDVAYDKESAVYYFASTSVGNGIDVFVNNAALTGNSAENYEILLSVENDAKANITKRTLKVKVIPVERDYEKNNYSVALTFEPVANTLAAGDTGFVKVDEGAAVGVAYDMTANGKKYVDKAGVHNVEVSGITLTGDRAGNYTLELINLDGLSVEILKAEPSYPIPMTDVLTYVSGRTLSDISLGDKRWKWADEVKNEVPGAGVHTYKAIFTPDDTANFATVEYNVDVEVLKAVVTITAVDFTRTYGEIEPTYYYEVDGLTGADTIKNSVDGYVLMNCSYTAGSDVGQYDIVLTGAFESPNYDFIYKNGKVTVNKRPAYVEAFAVNRPYEKDRLTVDVNFSAISNLYGSDGANDVFLEGSFPIVGKISDENAGIKNVEYAKPALAGAKAGNYELRLLNPTLTVEILKATYPNVILPVSGTVGYGQRLSTVKYTSSYSGTEYGTFSMENPTTTPTEVGVFEKVYKVIFTPYNTQNYATITQYITLTVEPSELNVAISLTGTLQSGKSLYVIVSDIPSNAYEYLFFEWYRVDSPDADPRTGVKVASGTDAYTLTEGDAGKYILCTVTNENGAPYTCFAKCVTDSAIEEQQLTFWQKLVAWFYRLISNITQIFGRIM